MRIAPEAAVLVALALLMAGASTTQAPAFATLYTFKGGTDGASPNGVTLGLAPAKGAAWIKTVLHNFNGADGALPSSIGEAPPSKPLQPPGLAPTVLAPSSP